MAGGGHIIIHKALAVVGNLGAVQDQLGPVSLAKLRVILGKRHADWVLEDAEFVLDCIRDALEALE